MRHETWRLGCLGQLVALWLALAKLGLVNVVCFQKGAVCAPAHQVNVRLGHARHKDGLSLFVSRGGRSVKAPKEQMHAHVTVLCLGVRHARAVLFLRISQALGLVALLVLVDAAVLFNGLQRGGPVDCNGLRPPARVWAFKLPVGGEVIPKCTALLFAHFCFSDFSVCAVGVCKEEMEADALQCRVCSKHARRACNRCHATLYCSKACQLVDWKTHEGKCASTSAFMKRVNSEQASFFEARDLEHADASLDRRGSVFLKNNLVYKLCQSEREYLETYIFFKRHKLRGIVPYLVEYNNAALVIVTRYMPEFITLHRIVTDKRALNKEALQTALIRGLARFKQDSFGKDGQANLRNIGFDGQDIMFFEDNGERFVYKTKVEMIVQYLGMLQNARSGKKLLGTLYSRNYISAIVDKEAPL
jgi:hypothetical protein